MGRPVETNAWSVFQAAGLAASLGAAAATGAAGALPSSFFFGRVVWARTGMYLSMSAKPCFFSKTATLSDGLAPFEIQYSTLSFWTSNFFRIGRRDIMPEELDAFAFYGVRMRSNHDAEAFLLGFSRS